MVRRGKSQARRQRSHGTPIWAWLLVGLSMGLLAYFVYTQYLNYKKPTIDEFPMPQLGTEDPASEKPTEPPASGMKDGVLDTDYSFYDVLPTQDTVDVEADPEAEASSPESTTDKTVEVATSLKENNPNTAIEPAKTVTSDNARYMLQAGSFERNADAENLKARIAMSGEPARVEEAEVNGKTMYRVRLGPYENTETVSAAQTALSNQGIQSNRIKIK